MAKATATCTCATCGATFTRTNICRNRREADGWEAWAAANFDECDACYTARKASGITEPVKPVCYPAGRWNGKVYGTAAYGYRIYVDNAEIRISNDDADALKNYAKALAAWREATKGGKTQ